MHSSTRRAREILDRGEQQRVEYEAWQAEHAGELAILSKHRADDVLVYKTRDDALVPRREVEQTTYITERMFDEVLDGICKEVGSILGTAEKELRIEIQTLRAELAELRGQTNKGGVIDLPSLPLRRRNA
jgi:hypothetical protein